jgi:hypothetical protein
MGFVTLLVEDVVDEGGIVLFLSFFFWLADWVRGVGQVGEWVTGGG